MRKNKTWKKCLAIMISSILWCEPILTSAGIVEESLEVSIVEQNEENQNEIVVLEEKDNKENKTQIGENVTLQEKQKSLSLSKKSNTIEPINSLETRTEEQIREKYKQYMENYFVPIIYEEKPSITAPYKAGKISELNQQAALGTLNFIRYVAGLPDDISLDETYGDCAQHGVVVNAANDILSHYPSKPQDMEESFYNIGYSGTSNSNMGFGFSNIQKSILEGYMDDSDVNNIASVGHRRWALDPSMTKVGFGFTYGKSYPYTAMYVMGSARGIDSELEYVSWPAKLMPMELYQYNKVFSISLGSQYDYIHNTDNIEVKVTSKNDGKTYTFCNDSEKSDGEFYVVANDNSTGVVGEMRSAIIFNPSRGLFTDGDHLDISISGLTKSGIDSTLDYTVDFFSIGSQVTELKIYDENRNFGEDRGDGEKIIHCSVGDVKTFSVDIDEEPIGFDIGREEIVDIEGASSNSITLKAVQQGLTRITATTMDGKKESIILYIDSEDWNYEIDVPSSIRVEEQLQASAKIIPESQAGRIQIGWKSLTPEIVSIDENGMLTGINVGRGRIQITFTYINENGATGRRTTFKDIWVSIDGEDWSYEIDMPSSIRVEEQLQASAKIIPESQTDRIQIEWKSLTPEIVSIDENGMLTGINVGQGRIRITFKDGETNGTITFKNIWVNARKEEEVLLERATISPSYIRLVVGASQKCYVNYYPENTTEDTKSGYWLIESPDPGVIRINYDGTITGIKEGRTFFCKQVGPLITPYVYVDVVSEEEAEPLTSISLSDSNINLEKGQTKQLIVSYNPSTTTDDRYITWTSSNSEIVKVNQEGNITALELGTATITAKTANGKTATCTVTVKAAVNKTELQDAIEKYSAYKESDYASGWSAFEKALADATTVNEKADATQEEVDNAVKVLEEAAGSLIAKKPITSIALNKTKLELEEGKTEKLTVTYNPADTTDEKKVTWTSDKESIAKVASDGTVTAVSAGTATITAKTANGKTATCAVTVKAVVSKVKLQEAIDTYSAYKENDYASGWSAFKKALADATAVNEKADATQAEVDNAVKALEEAAGSLVAKKPITSIALNKTKLELEEGKTEKLTVTYNPADTTDEKKVTWTSDKESVAKVASDGTVTAVSAGTATITAKTANGKTATCTVTVKAAVNKTELQDAIEKYSAYKENDYASGWSAFEKALADAKTVNEKADATQTEVDNAVKALEEAAGSLVAKRPITSIALNKTKLELEEGKTEKLTVTYNPADTTDEKKVTWTSDKESVAKVASDGTVTAVSAGTATITAKTANGKTATCTVTVKAAPVVVDKTKLQEAIDTYSAYKESDYASGWSAFEKALADANTINEKADATQAEVDNAVKALEEAAGSLVAKRPITSIALSKTKLELEEGKTEKLTVTYHPADTTDEKKVTWTSDKESVAKVSSDGTVTAVSAGTATITAKTVNGKTATCTVTVKQVEEPEKPVQIYYSTHIQNLGWQSYMADGVLSGTTGKSLRLEGIKIYLENNKIGGGVEYRTHVQNLGWQSYVADGAMAGTTGKSLRLEAIQIRLTGEIAEKYDVYYRTHIQDIGWLGWTLNDGKSGSAGLSKRLEGIQIRLVEKGGTAPGTTENAYMTNEKVYNPSISYSTHVQNLGWQFEVKDGVMSGTKGKSLRLEGIKIRVNGDGLKGGIEYCTHIQNLGWQPYVSNGELSGTKGKSLRLEGIKIRLTGELAEKYSVEYRTHVQNLGWQPWVKDNTLSGTKGKSLRLEAIEIRLVKK